MSKFALLGAAAVLSTMSMSALHAQAGARELGACPSLSVASSETRAPAPTADWLPAGCERSTLPWSAPVGHRQPQLIDVTAVDRPMRFGCPISSRDSSARRAAGTARILAIPFRDFAETKIFFEGECL